MHTDLKFKMQEKEVKFKEGLKKAKDEEFLRVKNIFMKKINGLNDAIQSIFSRDIIKYFLGRFNFSISFLKNCSMLN